MKKKLKRVWHCDWRDWRDYVIQKKTLKKYDAVIGVIMWFRKKTEKIWRCDWREYMIQYKNWKNFDAVIGVIDVIQIKNGKTLTLWLAWLCDSVKNWNKNWRCDWRD